MNRILFACLLVIAGAGPSLSQTGDQSALLCTLPREKAPSIRGVKLGMTADELYAAIPGMRADYKPVLEQAQKFPEYGSATLGATPIETGKGQKFDGIEGFWFHLFDDHVTQYTVFYRGPNSNPRGPTWSRSDDLIARIADGYNLPGPANWVVNGDFKLLRCKGFEVRVSISNGTQVIITEPGNVWVAEQKKRREAYEEQLRHDFKP